MDFIESQTRALYRLLNHGDELSDLRCIDVNEGRLVDRSLVAGEEAVVEWARSFNGKGNCFIGRNPRKPDGNVSRITTFTYDIDPAFPKGSPEYFAGLDACLEAGRIITQEIPGGYLAASGNGALVVYRLEQPADRDFKGFEERLSASEKYFHSLFAARDLNAKCDHTFDTPRIIKLLGTTSTKGDRAHWRVARFIDLPSPPYRGVPAIPGLSAEERRATSAGQPAGRAVVPLHAQDFAVAFRCKREGLEPSEALATIGRSWVRPVEIGTLDGKLQLASGALARLAPERREEYDAWLRVGLALRELGPIGLQLWDSWSRGSSKYEEGICEKKWATFEGDPKITVGSLEHWAREDQRAVVATAYAVKPESISEDGAKAIEIKTLADRAAEYLQHLEGRAAQASPGISTGFRTLDRLLGGCRGGEFIVVASRTGLGKTSFICNVSGGLVAGGKKVALFSTEMDWQSIAHRVIASYYGLASSDVERGRLSPERLVDVTKFFSGPGENFLLDDAPTAPIDYVRDVVLKFKPDVVIYDHVQRAGTDPSDARQQISGFTKGFKNLMRESGSTGILLSQIRRLGKDKKGHFFEPALSDLKESGTIEEEAAAVMLLHWPSESTTDRYVQIVANLAKNRYGQTDYFELYFDRQTTRFTEDKPHDAVPDVQKTV